jgi:hypothetical protein
MNTDIIVTEDNTGRLTIHFEGDVTFLSGWEYAGDLPNKGVDIVAYSNEFEKLRSSKTVET